MALTTYIALLRGVNVGGKKAVAMADLRALAADLGYANPRTLLRSGNLVFGAESDPAGLEAQLEQALLSRLGLATQLMVRTSSEWSDIIVANPFPAEADEDPAHLLMVALKAAPAPGALASLQGAIPGRERAAGRGRELYIVFPNGIGTSKLTGELIARKIGVPGTARNWNTVLKLAAMAAAG